MGSIALLYPGPQVLHALAVWPELPEPPAVWATLRTVGLLAGAALLPLLALGRQGGEVRALCGSAAACSMAFAVASGGDWMAGFRWFSLASGPLAVLFAVGVAEAASWASRWGGAGMECQGWIALSSGVGGG